MEYDEDNKNRNNFNNEKKKKEQMTGFNKKLKTITFTFM